MNFGDAGVELRLISMKFQARSTNQMKWNVYMKKVVCFLIWGNIMFLAIADPRTFAESLRKRVEYALEALSLPMTPKTNIADPTFFDGRSHLNCGKYELVRRDEVQGECDLAVRFDVLGQSTDIVARGVWTVTDSYGKAKVNSLTGIVMSQMPIEIYLKSFRVKTDIGDYYVFHPTRNRLVFVRDKVVVKLSRIYPREDDLVPIAKAIDKMILDAAKNVKD